MSVHSKWVYSTVPEWFVSDSFDCKEDAIDAAKQDGLSSFYIGQTVVVHPIMDAEHALEQVAETIYDEVGEAAEGYLDDVSEEEFEELQQGISRVFEHWLKKFNHFPTFYKVDKIEKIEG